MSYDKKSYRSVVIVLLATAGLGLMTTQSSAALVPHTIEANWNADVASSTLEDFESADIGDDGDDNSGAEDVSSGPVLTPNLFNDLQFGTNANFFSNASIQVPSLVGNNAQIGVDPDNVVFDLNFFGYSGTAEFVEVTLPAGSSAFSFVYRQGDGGDDGTVLTVDGVAVPGFNAFDSAYDNANGSFFGVVKTTGAISKFRLTAAENPAGSIGTTTFNSFDNLQYGVAVPEPASLALLGVAGIAVLGMRRKEG